MKRDQVEKKSIFKNEYFGQKLQRVEDGCASELVWINVILYTDSPQLNHCQLDYF